MLVSRIFGDRVGTHTVDVVFHLVLPLQNFKVQIVLAREGFYVDRHPPRVALQIDTGDTISDLPACQVMVVALLEERRNVRP